MKFFLDHNLSHHLARGLNELSRPFGVSVIHLTDKFDRKASDTHWIEELTQEGDWVIVSQDRFLKNPAEKEALRRAGLVVFALKHAWAKETYWNKASQLVRWWPLMIEQAGLVSGGAVFEVQWKFTGKFTQVQL